MKPVPIVILLLFTSALPCASAESSPAMADYERAQAARQQARAARAKDPSPEGLQRAEEILAQALAQLDRNDVRERAEGNVYLYFRRHDINMDLAAIRAARGDRDGALRALDAMSRVGWTAGMVDFIEKMPDLASLKDDPRFQAVMARLRLPKRIYSDAFAVPYQERLPVEQRIAGLSVFWSFVRHHFVHFDNVPQLTWDEVYLQFLPRVIAAETTADYYRVLMQLAPLLQDGHTNIYPPRELQSSFYAGPPLTTEWVQGKVLVSGVHSASLAERVKAGDELVAVDGEPVLRYARERVEPYVSSSTPQDRRLRTFSYQLLRGDAKQELRLTLRGADGRERVETVSRAGYADQRNPEPFEFRMLADDVAYLSLDSFVSDAGVKAFVAALPKILEARGLVLDLRRNGGGSTQYGNEILSYLTGREIPQAMSQVRGETGLDLARGTNIGWKPSAPPMPGYRPERARRFEGKVVVLAGPRTFSAGEDFLVAFLSLRRGEVIGEATGGSTGQPLSFPLPGGGIGRVCVKRDMFPDGTRFVGVGIEPTVRIETTVEDVRAGRDPVLDAALRRLRS